MQECNYVACQAPYHARGKCRVHYNEMLMQEYKEFASTNWDGTTCLYPLNTDSSAYRKGCRCLRCREDQKIRNAQRLQRELEANEVDECEVCHRKELTGRRLAQDHNHKTMKLRGRLCMRCNTALGSLQDNPEIVMSLYRYLMKYVPLP